MGKSSRSWWPVAVRKKWSSSKSVDVGVGDGGGGSSSKSVDMGVGDGGSSSKSMDTGVGVDGGMTFVDDSTAASHKSHSDIITASKQCRRH